MHYGDSKSAPPDFRVLTRIYPHGRPAEIESVVPLHPKVKAYLEHRADFLRFEIYDSARQFNRGYGLEHIANRKIYYVPYRSANLRPAMLGEGAVMIFDQLTGELLYQGSDGGE
jgi:hypothetical protein